MNTDSTFLDRVPPGLLWLAAGLVGGLVVGVFMTQAPDESTTWPTYADVYQDVSPSVVNVAVSGTDALEGTGFAVGTDKVVTARHLVAGAERITIRGLDGVVFDAVVLGADARTDLALLDVPGAQFQPARLGRSHGVLVGDTVLAIGNPYGLGHSLAQGIVGGAQRAINSAEGDAAFIQLSIPLNPGNSGGPIVDDRGLVVGVLAGTHAQGQSIAFAVPVDVLVAALPSLLRGQQLTRGWVGLRGSEHSQGMRIEAVVPGGPADRAGVRVGDVVTGLAGQPAGTPEAFALLLDTVPAGGKVTLDLLRDGERRSLPLLLADRASRSVVASGMTLRAAPGAGGEVVAVRPGSRADRSGIREGDVVRVVDGYVVQSPADVQDLLVSRDAVPIEVLREGTAVNVVLGAV